MKLIKSFAQSFIALEFLLIVSLGWAVCEAMLLAAKIRTHRELAAQRKAVAVHERQPTATSQ